MAIPHLLFCARDLTLQEVTVQPLNKAVQALLSHTGTLLLPLQHPEPSMEVGVDGSEASGPLFSLGK